MMGKKTKRLYGRMQHGIQEKQKFVESLEKKRKENETASNEIKDKSSSKKMKTKKAVK